MSQTALERLIEDYDRIVAFDGARDDELIDALYAAARQEQREQSDHLTDARAALVRIARALGVSVGSPVSPGTIAAECELAIARLATHAPAALPEPLPKTPGVRRGYQG